MEMSEHQERIERIRELELHAAHLEDVLRQIAFSGDEVPLTMAEVELRALARAAIEKSFKIQSSGS